MPTGVILAVVTLTLVLVAVACQNNPPSPTPTALPLSMPIFAPTTLPSTASTPNPTILPTATFPPVATQLLISTVSSIPTPTPVPAPIPTPVSTPTPTVNSTVLYVKGWNNLANSSWLEYDQPLMASDIKTAWWVADGITTTFETMGVQSLISLVIWAEVDRATLLHILESPFLESIEPPDTWALNELRYFAENEKPYFDRLMEQPAVQNGITDSTAKLIGALYVLDYDRDLRPLVQHTYMAERVVDLPVSGKTYLTVLRVGQTPATATLDRLGAVVRALDNHLQLPLPHNILLVISDKAYNSGGTPLDSDYYTGLNYGGQMVVLEELDTEVTGLWGLYAVIAHETAHYIFKNGPTWIVEGFSEGAQELLAWAIGGESLDLDHWEMLTCPGIETYDQLEAARLKVNDKWDAIVSGDHILDYCEIQFGRRVFVRLYLELGPDLFRKGLEQLHPLTIAFSRKDPPTVEDVVAAFGPEAWDIIYGGSK